MIYLNHLGIICAPGNSREEVWRRVFESAESGITPTEQYSPGRTLPLGCVNAALPAIGHLPLQQRSRNNQLALAALAQIRTEVDAAIARFGANRIGIMIGTSTSGIAESEAALREHVASGKLPDTYHYGQQELGSPATMLASVLGTNGPAYVHSTACASSSKAMASAARLLNMGLCDAVICGGVDSLCAFTVAGFASLESVSDVRCNPLSANRKGINIGEGAALFLMTREPAAVALRGWGESSDAHHMSAPDPAGTGATIAMEKALARAGIKSAQIDYINLHGTATLQNDAMESRAVHGLFGNDVAVSSTKGFTGHALGAAGAIEAALCWLAMQDDNAEGVLPPHLWDGERDTGLPALNAVAPGTRLGRRVEWALSNSFAFGGANAALVFGRG
ncbi:3-oxoacyl-[acyl-carrier-protein] synthase-1 [Paucimonas lemoignei]|uniref:3-oxoacyl-[acyl-carrier-protein] synthase-1 n=1 Tax=Paucimonas lemoignei TaxID=29443 RepID=A0A4R3HW10_PAULE|nr:beta-ketoacyl-ACP synthase [Paucimonas lemoignei]TCS35549.1 3-oxoacyl-[acyl-carrier-protein] synthase-1 [Paucimonas lemoignei]